MSEEKCWNKAIEALGKPEAMIMFDVRTNQYVKFAIDSLDASKYLTKKGLIRKSVKICPLNSK